MRHQSGIHAAITRIKPNKGNLQTNKKTLFKLHLEGYIIVSF